MKYLLIPLLFLSACEYRYCPLDNQEKVEGYVTVLELGDCSSATNTCATKVKLPDGEELVLTIKAPTMKGARTYTSWCTDKNKETTTIGEYNGK